MNENREGALRRVCPIDDEIDWQRERRAIELDF